MKHSSTSVFLKLMLQRRALAMGARMSLIVGTILNLINQGSELLFGQLDQINYPKFFLTFLVPFSVSLYSSTTTKMRFYTGEYAFFGARLLCKACGGMEQDVKEGERIGECAMCRKKTFWKPLAVLHNTVEN